MTVQVTHTHTHAHSATVGIRNNNKGTSLGTHVYAAVTDGADPGVGVDLHYIVSRAYDPLSVISLVMFITTSEQKEGVKSVGQERRGRQCRNCSGGRAACSG